MATRDEFREKKIEEAVINALCHAIEAYCSPYGMPPTNVFALEANGFLSISSFFASCLLLHVAAQAFSKERTVPPSTL
jgi:hypothetical protein